MRWQGRRTSYNVEDRRGMRAGPVGGGLGLLVLLLIGMFFGVDPRLLFQIAQTTSMVTVDENNQEQSTEPPQDELGQFVSVVLADTEETWHEVFRQMGRSYEEPKLVLFNGMVRSACGMAQSAVGPFYCPADHDVYLDLTFFRELHQRFGAPGDFAQAYVIAHEIGHHVQNLLGIHEKVRGLQQRMNDVDANQLSVRTELQADCFAGVWGHHADKTRDLLEQGDVEEGLNAASAIGDDRLQKQAQGHVVPESFTHGSAEQRVRWFRRGIESGDVSTCDTFNKAEL
jgi:predicted metalloprotease